MKAGGIYRLNNYFGSNNKILYRVAEPSFTITFSTTSVLSDLEDSPLCFPEDRFQIHGYEEFDAACDLQGDLYGGLVNFEFSKPKKSHNVPVKTYKALTVLV
ncbi:hypothetical protein YC2023_085416 [Brassica napus]